MKKIALLVALLVVQSDLTAAVLLEKITYPGFVMPAYAIVTSCKLTDSNQIVFEKQIGSLKSSQTLPLKLTVDNIKTQIGIAATGTITSESFPVDAQTTRYQGYNKQANGKLKAVLLWEEGAVFPEH